MSLRDWSPQIRWIGGSLLLGSTLGILSLSYQSCRGPDGVKPSIRDTGAVLAASRASDSTFHAGSIDSGAALARRATVHDGTIAVLSSGAERNRATADSLAALALRAATASDSARLWRMAFEAERLRSTKLQSALDFRTKERDDALASSARYRTADSSSQARLARVEGFNSDLQKELERLSQPCRILPGIPCPSRKQVLIAVGLGAGFAERDKLGELAKHLLKL